MQGEGAAGSDTIAHPQSFSTVYRVEQGQAIDSTPPSAALK
jgi:hypothetical protein